MRTLIQAKQRQTLSANSNKLASAIPILLACYLISYEFRLYHTSIDNCQRYSEPVIKSMIIIDLYATTRCEPVIILVIKERQHNIPTRARLKATAFTNARYSTKIAEMSWNKTRCSEYTAFNLSSEQSHWSPTALKMPTIKLQSSDSEVFPVDVEVSLFFFGPLWLCLVLFGSFWPKEYFGPFWTWI